MGGSRKSCAARPREWGGMQLSSSDEQCYCSNCFICRINRNNVFYKYVVIRNSIVQVRDLIRSIRGLAMLACSICACVYTLYLTSLLECQGRATQRRPVGVYPLCERIEVCNNCMVLLWC